MENLLKKNVEIAVNIDVAKRMLGVVGFKGINNMTDDEVFMLVLSLIEKYGASPCVLE